MAFGASLPSPCGGRQFASEASEFRGGVTVLLTPPEMLRISTPLKGRVESSALPERHHGRRRLDLVQRLDRVVAHRARFAEEIALREIDAVIEQLDDRLLVLDTLGDQIEAVALQQLLEIFRARPRARALPMPCDQRVGADLDMAETDLLQLARNPAPASRRDPSTARSRGSTDTRGSPRPARRPWRRASWPNSNTICPARSRL